MREGERSIQYLLNNIVIWGERLARFLHGISKEEFGRDELRQAGVSKCVEAIGEASGEIVRRYGDYAAANPQLALGQAYRARNRLSHGYDTIDWEILWDTAMNYVPALVADVRSQLAHGPD